MEEALSAERLRAERRRFSTQPIITSCARFARLRGVRSSELLGGFAFLMSTVGRERRETTTELR